MKIAISGASGLIGSHVAQALAGEGHRVVRLVRRSVRTEDEIAWDGETPPPVGDCDAVVHLAGETIMGRWTAGKRARILESRRAGTRSIAAAVAAAPRPPVLVMASAVGYYGSRGDELLTEDSSPGSDFLASVAAQWEQAAEAARAAGARVVALRFGMVLTPAGGALKQMLVPFRLGLGGRIGSGAQWISWVALEDVVGAVLFALATPALSGPVNVVAPKPVTNADFTRVLGAVLHRPTILKVPAAMVKLVFGEMGEALLLGSQRVVPSLLQASGYRFRHTELEKALREMLRGTSVP